MSSTQSDNIASDAGAKPFDELAIRREARRAQRLRHLGEMRMFGIYLGEQLTDYVAGRLPYEERETLSKIEDPTLAFCRVAKMVRQTVALEERLDTEEEARAAGIAPKAPPPPKAAPSQKNDKDAIREAVSDTHAALRPEVEPEERERLLDDLFDDEEDEVFSGDPIVAMARICIQLGVTPPDWDEEDEAAPDRTVRLIARWIDFTRPRLDPLTSSKPPGKGQGPPIKH